MSEAEKMIARIDELERRIAALESKEQQGYVYFIVDEEGKRVKIGFSHEPEKRLRQLQTANAQRLTLLAAIPGTKEDERFLHQQFGSARGINEWFRMTSYLRQEIERLISAHP